MAVRNSTSIASPLLRATNLPTFGLYSACGWSVIDTDRNAQSVFFSLQGAGGSPFESFFTDSDGVTLRFQNSGGGFVTAGAQTVGQWFWWGITRTSNTVNLYIRQAGSETITKYTPSMNAQPGSPTRMSLLGAIAASQHLDGRGAGVKVWNAALSQAEIEREAFTLRPYRTQDLQMWTPMVHSTLAEAVRDFSGSGNDWTPGTGPTIEGGPPVSYGGLSIFPNEAPVSASDVTANLSGVSANGSAGSLAILTESTAALTGVAATGRAGTLTVLADSFAALSGVSAIGATGNMAVLTESYAGLDGEAGTGRTGNLTVVVDETAALTGTASTGATGTMTIEVTGDITVPITGVAGSGAAGTVVGVAPSEASGLDGVSFGGGAREYLADRTDRRHAAPGVRGAAGRGGAGRLVVVVDNGPVETESAKSETDLQIGGTPAAKRETVALRPRVDVALVLGGVAARGRVPAPGPLGVAQLVRDEDLEQLVLLAAGWR